ncbi:DNA-binding transcriptional MerR regulator [Aequitasia blattaphilus]|uniref:MerR family transcriptional regulator n=1 Tax=Aequitasia blattaphilus TaxID=2949332 RepID=A0ABT1E6M6_9FIRM|nr:MerR family transcriptional regulator [Aequitasia blattaphilus]MCP1101494.1 MerR family transcriptional regulator [Aequitasia blattaphilus]MCR8614134.1 MerR family transcriptional regulator [Aequitasia blattaphilus]
MYHVTEVARLTGVSVRTLHHYDRIGLLLPDKLSEKGYRLYSEENIDRLMQILFFKELDFSLKSIKEILDQPNYDRKEALLLQKKLLKAKQKQIHQMVQVLEKAVKEMEGEITMSTEEKFSGFHFDKNPYEKEAREKYGNKAVEESQKRLDGLDASEKEKLTEDMNEVFKKLSSLRHLSPDTPEAQAAIAEWYSLLNNNFSTYSKEAFKGLGELYVMDERFTKNIDEFGDGLATFMKEAMAVFAEKE